MKKLAFLLILSIFMSKELIAQDVVFGVITDTEGKPMANVTVQVKGGSEKTLSLENGSYSIVVPDGHQSLQYIFEAYPIKEIEVKSSEINVILSKDKVVNVFDLSFDELMNVKVVSSTKFEQKQSLAPSVISIVNNNTINNYDWHSMNDVLYKQAGFFPSQDFERATVGSRGITEGWNNNHLLLLIDGMPFNQDISGTALTNEATPLIFTKTFEIIKGPGSALYGSNATNGVLTLNTLSASDFDKNKVFASTRYGENNTAFYDILTTFKTKNIDITSSLSYNATDGEKYQSYDGSLEIDPTTKTLKKFEPKFDRYSGYFFLKLEGKDKIKGLSLQFHSQLTNTKTGHGWLWNIPDKEEKIRDSYNSLVLKYQKDITPNISGEFAVKYTHHVMNYDVWFYRTGASNGWYPDGVNEYLKSSFNSVFTRLQFIFKMPLKSTFLLATEPNLFMYSGDINHYTNTDLFNIAAGSPPFGENRSLGSLFKSIENKLVKNIGSFAQFSSGDLLGKFIQMTAGLRYDMEFFDYLNVNLPDKPLTSKSFEQFSPRLSIVIAPTERLTFKLLGVTAFRAPAPTELFGSNTWIFASNIDQLQSEKIKSAEFAVDYSLNQYMNLRMNTFYTVTDGIIGYSIGNNNLSTNIYDLTSAGIESEVQLVKGKFSAFANLAYIKRIDEKIFESELPYVSLSKNTLTWVPAFTANFGCTQYYKSFKFSLQGHYQGNVLRRDKDFYSSDELAAIGFTTQPRPTEVKPWVSIDTQVTYKYKFAEIGISGKNIFDSDNYLIKTLKYPFDYKMEGRRISFVLNIDI